MNARPHPTPLRSAGFSQGERRGAGAALALRYVLVGLGNIGQKRRAALGAQCVATVDPFNPDADAREVGAIDPARYDAAILSVPNDVKLELMRALLAGGKHVLVEKPLVFSGAEDAEMLSRSAQRAGAMWYTAYNHRFEPLIQRLNQCISDGQIGEVYSARLFYGNGTVSNVIGSFRDGGTGVVEDLGSHLLDLARFLFHTHEVPFRVESVLRQEASAPDHATLRSEDGRIALEMSFLSWKNTFTIDALGSRGSLHLDGLRKWGGSRLTVRERVFPSGVPRETVHEDIGIDTTWADELRHFETLVATGTSSFEGDRWISQTLDRVPV